MIRTKLIKLAKRLDAFTFEEFLIMAGEVYVYSVIAKSEA